MYLTFFYLQTFGWTPQEGKLHMVNDYFSPSEVIDHTIHISLLSTYFTLLMHFECHTATNLKQLRCVWMENPIIVKIKQKKKFESPGV